MRSFFLKTITLTCLFGLLLVPFSCTDLDFDTPPAGGEDPNLNVTTTIAQLKALHTLGQYEEITHDLTLAGIVISNDEAGNFYKQLVVQDASGGIEMRIEMADLHNIYPVGRKVYIKAKGLWLGDYNGLIQLGAGVGQDDQGKSELIRIPEPLVSKHIIPATFGNVVTPKILSIADLTLADVSTLVQLSDVQFIVADAGVTYADPVLQQTLNRDVEDCDGNTIILRNSGYSTFAGVLTPTGKGTMTGILGVFRSDFQFMIRDLNDVQMDGVRCDGTGGGQDIDESFTSIANDADIALIGWANIAVKGTRLWRGKIFQSNHYAQATAFGDQAAEMESWLITPPIILDVPKKITFESAYAFPVHEGLTVWISSNFNGTDVSGATWVQLHPTLVANPAAENTFIPSGDVDLSAYSGTVRIGFKYVGSGPGGQTTTFRIDNVKVTPL